MTYRVIKTGLNLNNGGGGNEVVSTHATFGSGALALRKAGDGHFLQGPYKAWWPNDVTRKAAVKA